MSIESWIALVLALTVLGFSPGPAFAAVVTTSISRGFRSAMAMSFGVALCDVVFLTFAIFGLTLLAKVLGTFFLIVKIAGAAYLIWLGIKLWRTPPASPDDMTLPPRTIGPFLTGFMLTLSNPKAIAFYLGFLPAFMDLAALSTIDIGVVALTTFIIIAGTLLIYAAVATKSRRLLRKEIVRKRMGRVLGSTMIGAGVVLASR